MNGAKLRYRFEWQVVGLALVALVVFLSVTRRPPPDLQLWWAWGDKLEHGAAYALLMLWYAQLYDRRWSRAVVAVLLIGLGLGMEFIQQTNPLRTFDLYDAVANTVGVVAGWLLALTRLDRILAGIEARLP